jgi:TonB family protein
VIFCCLWFALSPKLGGVEAVELQMRLYQGVKKSASGEAAAGSAGFALTKIADEYVLPDFEFSKELRTIVKVYNLEYAHFQYKLNMVLKKGREGAQSHEIQLSGRTMELRISEVKDREDRFLIEMLRVDADAEPLLETEIIVPEERTAVLGFEDTGGRIYFLALNRRSDREFREENGTPKSVQGPKLVKRSMPPYPAAARENKTEGVVILEAHTDAEGNVTKIFDVSGPPGLIEAARKSVRQWKYSPWRINGVAEPIRCHLMIIFRLKEGSSLKEAEGVKSVDDLYQKYKPMMKRWQYMPEVSSENQAIVEMMIVEG